MKSGLCLLCFLWAAALFAAPQEGEVVFRSDVALVRVDVQALDRDNRAITGLAVEDFALREEGTPQEIRNFATESMPVDILLLLDVSGSMRVHLERISSASHQALQVLGENDRVGIMVFDRMTRIRLPFASRRTDVSRHLELLLDQESFNGGTDITGALQEAARYVQRHGRSDARRAIVIVTDDQTEFERDDAKVLRALSTADAVLSALIVPNAGQYGGTGGPRSYPGGGYPGGRSPRGWPGGGWPGGGWPGGGGGGRGPVWRTAGTKSAGTATIARESGGDSFGTNEASALERSLSRLRQRYALYFQLPAGVRSGEERSLAVELASAASRRYPGAELRFRKTYVTSSGSAPTEVSAQPSAGPSTATTEPGSASASEAPAVVADRATTKRRRRAVNETGGQAGPNPSVGGAPASGTESRAEPAVQPQGGWRRVDEPQGGWRRVDEPAPKP
jgi:VWFA-related protein